MGVFQVRMTQMMGGGNVVSVYWTLPLRNYMMINKHVKFTEKVTQFLEVENFLRNNSAM